MITTAPYTLGQAYFIRTVTMYFTGRLKAVFPNELLFSDAAWIADTGIYSNAFTTGEFYEVEPIVGDAIIGRGSVIDAVAWPHELPRDRKCPQP